MKLEKRRKKALFDMQAGPLKFVNPLYYDRDLID